MSEPGFGDDNVAYLLTPTELGRRAALTVRCDDCGGAAIAHVTYMRGEPVLWTRPQRRRGRRWTSTRMLSLETAASAFCREREYALRLGVADVPKPGSAHVQHIRVRHGE